MPVVYTSGQYSIGTNAAGTIFELTGPGFGPGSFTDAVGVYGPGVVAGLIAGAGYYLYNEAVAGCGSGPTNNALGSLAWDVLSNDIAGGSDTLRFLLDCVMKEGEGTPEY